MRAVNRQQRIKMNQTAVSQSDFVQSAKVPNKADGEEYRINDEGWTKGSVFRYLLNCENCTNGILLTNKVEVNRSQIAQIHDARDVLSDWAGSGNILVLGADKVYYFTEEMMFKLSVPLQGIDAASYQCDSIYPLQDNTPQRVEFALIFCLKLDKQKQPVNYVVIMLDVVN